MMQKGTSQHKVPQQRALDINIPDNAMFAVDSLETILALTEVWKSNHQEFLNFLKTRSIPFLAFNGSGKQTMESLPLQDNVRLEVATYYEIGDIESHLFRLYHACAYVSTYAFRARGEPGAILVFNTELDGSNAADRWEHLKPGTILSMTLVNDSERTKAELQALNRSENLMQRACICLQKEVFQYSLLKIIPYQELRTHSELMSLTKDNMAAYILANRFAAQEVLMHALEAVS